MIKDRIKEPSWEIFIKIILVFSMTTIFLIPLMDTLHTPLSSFGVLLLTFFTCIFIHIFFARKFVRILSYIIFPLAIFIYIYRLLSYGSGAFDRFFTSLLPAILIVIATSIFLYIFVLIYISFIMCFSFIFAISLGMIVEGYAFPIFSFSLLLVLLYIVFILERTTSLFYGSSEENRKIIKTPIKMTFSMFITYILLFILLTSPKIPSGPLLGERADKIADGILLRFGELFGNRGEIDSGGEKNIFDLSSLGFGDTNQLGGDVTLQDHRVLTVYSKYSGIYLAGIAHEEYTGSQWINNAPMGLVDLKDKRYSLESVISERRYGLGGLSLDSAVVIRHAKAFRTSTVFSPANSFTFSFSNQAISLYYGPSVWQREVSQVRRNTHDKVGAVSIIPENGGYIASYYYLDKKDDTYEKLLDKSYPGFYRDQNEAHNYFSTIPSYLNLVERSERFHEEYLKVPETLPKRVYNLAKEITKDARTNYEKILAVEKYLQENYTYTLTPGDLPEGYDFVDYFLFEKKEGYCTYYASAMTILLRTLDIPTRYVTGFVVREENFVERERFQVLASDAHAWPEVYFEGIGFISFEPTSSFEGIARQEVSTLATAKPFTPKPSLDVSPSPSPTKEPDLTKKPTQKPKVTNEGKEDIDRPNLSLTAAIIIATIILMPLVSSFVCFLIKMKKKKDFKRLSNKDAVIYIFRKYEKTLAKNHLKRDPFETLSDYTLALLKRPYFKREEIKDIHLTLIDFFNQARYSDYEIDENMRYNAINLYDQFCLYEKEHLGRIKFFFRT